MGGQRLHSGDAERTSALRIIKKSQRTGDDG